jgi:hypothetical protein
MTTSAHTMPFGAARRHLHVFPPLRDAATTPDRLAAAARRGDLFDHAAVGSPGAMDRALVAGRR